MRILYYCENDDDDEILTALKTRLPNHDLQAWPQRNNPSTITAAIVFQPPVDFFEELTSLSHVLSIAAGVDHLLDHPRLPASVEIVRLVDAGMAEPMSDYVLYGVLYAQRRMQEIGAAQALARWNHNLKPRAKKQLTIGILGAGELGTTVANRLQSNGYSVGCWSRTEKPQSDIKQFSGASGLDRLVANSQVLVCLLPLTESTTHIINAELMAKLPTGAFIINAGRGGHVDSAALLHMLDKNHLSGALLDVFDTEPLPATDPLWQHEKIVVTPHVAAPTDIAGAVEQIGENVELIERNEQPSGLVDRRAGY